MVALWRCAALRCTCLHRHDSALYSCRLRVRATRKLGKLSEQQLLGGTSRLETLIPLPARRVRTVLKHRFLICVVYDCTFLTNTSHISNSDGWKARLVQRRAAETSDQFWLNSAEMELLRDRPYRYLNGVLQLEKKFGLQNVR